jgi:hypothetical protein
LCKSTSCEKASDQGSKNLVHLEFS